LKFLVIALIAALVALPGVRLHALARKTRELPETLLAAFFLAMGAGILLRLLGVGSEGGSAGTGLALTLTLLGHVTITIGLVAVLWFTRIVFRPTNPGALWLTISISAVLIATCGALFAPGAAHENSSAVFHANASRLLPFIWLFVESVGQYGRMRRRDRLGIGDPIVTNRFLLWSVWTGVLAALPMVVIGFRIAVRVTTQGLEGAELEAATEQALGHVRIVLLFASLGIVASVWGSFFPSERYLQWVRARAEAAPV
jgi:hypothetical protein